MKRYKRFIEKKIKKYSLATVAYGDEVTKILRSLGIKTNIEIGGDFVTFSTDEQTLQKIIKEIKHLDTNKNMYIRSGSTVVWDHKKD